MMVTINVKRPLLFRGERREAGMHLDVQPVDAADLLASGRAELLREQDAPTVKDAVMAATRAALGTKSHHNREPGPWTLR